ncbi:hypothetical protein C1N80_04840 [Brachybacterium sp. SGAir0954]|uniref:hypothetical protein n=1 Tax=Brachybacterium sp. SGAir0954 TaxID=2571029 RepID=UPI0010CD2A60|nr:hypothetical protein [Brachybacterium sp. SGAir0954]QCR52973.1 hypothetical protein C1N80_04840 [Brachybacterium sp. SGAir0954]
MVPTGAYDAATAAIGHEIHRTAFVHAFGGAIDTGGLAAVALRFDHGLVNFAEHLLPLAVDRGITVSQAYNPRNGDLKENRGVLHSEIDDWIRQGHVEIWNHSSSHRGVTTTADLHDEIVAAIGEIGEQLPSAQGKLWGFNPPGIPGEDYAGFDKGSTPENWMTEAGRMILAHHAVASGHVAGTSQRILDGQVRDGLAHVTLDTRSVDEICRRIDAVVRKRRGLQLMMHPSRLGMDGKITLDEVIAILDHIVELRDQGRLVTLSPYELLLANAQVPTSADTSPR